MAFKPSHLTAFFATLAIVGRVLFYVVTPLWVDYFKSHAAYLVNISNSSNTNHTNLVPLHPSSPIYREINVIFVVVGQYAFSTIICGSVLIGITLLCPGKITEKDTGYPKWNFFIVGFAQGISSILINFSVSGSRTAPYLQAILSNFGIPIQFIIRFVLLRKKPTCLKTICASAVIAAEFMCLLPTIFPSLESAKEEKVEGGASGPGRVLWPMCMVLSMVPYAIANSIMEKSVQDNPQKAEQGRPSGESSDCISDDNEAGQRTIAKSDNQVHLVYFLFWWCFFNTLTVAGLFWVDFIPGFGTSATIVEFGRTLKFDIGCLFGAAGPEVACLGWINFSSNLIGAVAFVGLMRFSEGASFVVIVLAMRTPIVFLFWTLFSEQPFSWRPHVALSTYLSIAAIFVMMPAVAVYNVGLPRMRWCNKGRTNTEDDLLLPKEDSHR